MCDKSLQLTPYRRQLSIKQKRMTKKFTIEFIHNERKNSYVLARMVGEFDFELNDESTLGPIDIKPIIDRPRATKPDGYPDISIFSFIPKDRMQLKQICVGEEVELN